VNCPSCANMKKQLMNNDEGDRNVWRRLVIIQFHCSFRINLTNLLKLVSDEECFSILVD